MKIKLLIGVVLAALVAWTFWAAKDTPSVKAPVAVCGRKN